MNRKTFRHGIALILISMMGLQLFHAVDKESPTRDEPLHLIRGLAFWWEKDTRLSYAHPPLGNAITALGVVLTEPKIDITQTFSWQLGDVDNTYVAYQEKNFPKSYEQIFQAKRVTIILALVLGLYIYLWTLSFFGWPVAAVALLLYSLNPIILANARLITTDFPVTFFATIFIGEWIRYLRNGWRRTFFTAATFCGAAIATKYNAVFLVGFAGLSWLYCWCFNVRDFRGQSHHSFPKRFIFTFTCMALTILAVINASYRFQGTFLSVQEIFDRQEPRNYITKAFDGGMMETQSPLKHLPRWLPIPLPYTFVFGITSVKAQLHRSHRSYFMGKVIKGGVPGYFPTLILAKSQVVVTLSLLAGVFWLIYRRKNFSLLSVEKQLLILFAAAYLLSLIYSNLNIGVRHALIMISSVPTKLHTCFKVWFSLLLHRTKRQIVERGIIRIIFQSRNAKAPIIIFYYSKRSELL